MNIIDGLIKALIGTFGIGFVQLAVSYLLPPPFSHIHIALVAMILILFLYEHGSIIWLSAIWFFMLETVAVTPFGIIFLAGVFATLFVYILYREVFTNRSLFSAIILFSIAYVVYRTVYTLLFSVYALYGSNIRVPISTFTQVFILEWAVSAGFLVLAFLIVRMFSRQLQSQRIEESWFKKLGS